VKTHKVAIKKLSQYLAKKGISDGEFVKIVLVVGLSAAVAGLMICGAVGALLQ